MKKKELMSYVDDYITYGNLMGDSSSAPSKHNATYKKMEKIFGISINSDDKELFYKTVLEKTNDVNTLTSCYVHMLKLGIDVKQALKGLEKISQDESLGILRFNAEMCLHEWSNGNIKPVKTINELK